MSIIYNPSLKDSLTFQNKTYANRKCNIRNKIGLITPQITDDFNSLHKEIDLDKNSLTTNTNENNTNKNTSKDFVIKTAELCTKKIISDSTQVIVQCKPMMNSTASKTLVKEYSEEDKLILFPSIKESNKEKDLNKNNKENIQEKSNISNISNIKENNELRKSAEENEYLKKQIEELKIKIQNTNTNTNNNNDQEAPRPEEDEDEEKGEIIHDMKELELITDKINKGNSNQKIIINLLYKASVDGDKAAIFHEKCDQAKSTIVLVETLNGKRFGGFTTCSWSGNCEDKNDPQAFIFSLDKMETYDNIPGDEAIGCYPKFGPIFLGCQIKIFDNAFSKGGTTFEKELNFNTKEDYELTGGDRVFQIKEIEVYEVVIE